MTYDTCGNPIRVATYLCHNHYMSLPGNKVTYTTPLMGTEKCVVCGHKAEHDLSDIILHDEDLARFVVCYFNEVKKKFEITQEEIDECTYAWIHEDELGEHFCGRCNFPLTIVRPGKYQCETPWCPSNNQQEETK